MEDSNASIKSKIIREFVDILFSEFHFLLVGESLGAILYVIALWGFINQWILIAWILTHLCINGLLRHYMTYSYFKAKRENKLTDINIWHQRFLITAFISGIIWAIGTSFFLLINNPLEQLLIVFFMSAVIGAANVVFIPDKIGYMVFTIPIFISTIICLITQGTILFFSLGLAILAQFLLSTKLAFDASWTIIHSLAFQLKNTDLLHKIIMAKNKVEVANNSLINENETIYKVEKTLHELATHDQLTKLPNRHLLMSRVQQALERARRNNSYIAVLYVDLDYFKTINDTLGHDIGDKLLVQAANRMHRILRETDLIARLGGDEFCIVLDNIQDIKDVQRIAEKIITKLAEPFSIDDHTFTVSASIGIGMFPEHGNDIEKLFKNADIALYRAKEKGRNNYVFYSETT